MNNADALTLDVLAVLWYGTKSYVDIQLHYYSDKDPIKSAMQIAKAISVLREHKLAIEILPKGYTAKSYEKASAAFAAALSKVCAGKKLRKVVANPPPCTYGLTHLGKLIARNMR